MHDVLFKNTADEITRPYAATVAPGIGGVITFISPALPLPPFSYEFHNLDGWMDRWLFRWPL